MARPRYSPPLVVDRRFPRALMAEQDRVAVGSDEEWAALERVDAPALATLRFGQLRLALRGDDAALASALRADWGAFLDPSGGEPDATIALGGCERLPFAAPVAVPASARRGGELLVKMRGLALRIDAASGRASALVERAFPRQDLGNLLRSALAAFGWRRGEWLLRAAAVEVGGRAVLLAGPAHAGKSTAARLALPRPVLSDDAVLARREDDGIRIATAGFWGMEGSEGLEPVRERRELVLGGVFRLAKAAENRVVPVPRARAALELVAAIQTLPGDRDAARAALAFAEELGRLVPVFQLEFHHRDGSCWSAIEAALARPL